MIPGSRASQHGFRGRLLAASAVLALAGFPASGQPPQITGVRFWSVGGITRIAIQTDGEAQYRAERIDTPDRLVVDLIGVRRQPKARGIEVIPMGDRLARQIRIATLMPGVTRVVVDLNLPADFSCSQLKNPDRVIVELHQPGALPGPEAAQGTVPATRDAAREQPPAETPRRPPAPAANSKPADAPLKAGTAPATPALPHHAASRSAEAPAEDAGTPAVPVRKPETARGAASAKPEAARNLELEAISGREPAAKPEPAKSAQVPAGLSETPQKTEPLAPPPAKRAQRTLPDPPRIANPERDSAKGSYEAATAARPGSRGDTSLIRALGLKLDRVVLDPGHGGHDTGTIGPDGLLEKDLVLDVARRLGTLITQRMTSEVIFTRSDDTFIPLEERTRIANERKADLFLSIHANSSPSPRITGSETFYLNFSTSPDALDVAARENATSQRPIHELQDLVQKITLNEKVQESREFASTVQKALYAGLPRNRQVRNRGLKKAPFVVLIGASMPSVLAEIAFLSNPRDEALLKKPEYRERIAESLFKGISLYINTLSHYEVARQRQQQAPAQ